LHFCVIISGGISGHVVLCFYSISYPEEGSYIVLECGNVGDFVYFYIQFSHQWSFYHLKCNVCYLF